jgi:hypothetical protein
VSEPGPFGVREDGAPARRPAPQRPPPPGGREPNPRSTATWIVGIVVLIALAYITLNTLRTESPGSRGLQPGTQMPPFAAPLALSDFDEDDDANVNPGPGRGDRGERPACEVRGPQVLNSCELAERGPVVLAFLEERSDTCDRQIDLLDRMRARYPDVGFAAVAIRGDLDDLRDLVRRRRWKLPVGWDGDGAVANAYAVAVCPTLTFARQGGRVESTTLGLVDGPTLRRRIEAIRRGQTP